MLSLARSQSRTRTLFYDNVNVMYLSFVLVGVTIRVGLCRLVRIHRNLVIGLLVPASLLAFFEQAICVKIRVELLTVPTKL